MGVIVNPRGTSGSGKTEFARRVLAAYDRGGSEDMAPIHRDGRTRPIGYRLRHPLGGRSLAVVGHYGAGVCGGCDTISARDGGMDEVFRLAGVLAAEGHDVLLEGLLLSGEHRRSAELACRHALHVLLLDTPIERCARNLVARRRASRALRPLVAKVVAAQRDAVEGACARLRCCAATVETLDFDAALHRARELLGLRPVAARAAQRWPVGMVANLGDAPAVVR
jgi:hypothetical protein